MASTKHRFQNHYKEGFTPWVHSKPDFNLVDMVKNWPVLPCKTLELGCGTGTDAIWLAKQGFDVTAFDAVEIPIKTAQDQATKENVTANFLVKEFMKDEIPGGPFDFAFDRGYFHSYKSHVKRKKVAKTISELLSGHGIWLTLMGSCDSPPRDEGPPMRSAKDIVAAVEPYFEIKLLKTSIFGSESEEPANIWVGIFKKRS